MKIQFVSSTAQVPAPGKEEKRGKMECSYVATGEGGFSSPKNFGGFENDSTTLHRRVRSIEKKIEELMRREERQEETQDREFQRSLKERVRRLEDNEKVLRAENSKLREEVEKYKNQLREGLGKVEKEKETMNEWMQVQNNEKKVFQEVLMERVEKEKENMNAWREEQENEKKTFREVVEEQIKEKEEHMQEKMVGVIKKKETMIIGMSEKKKSVLIFGAKENNITYRPKREKMEMKMVRDLLKNLNDEDRQNLEEEVEEVHRMGPYREGGKRPIKVLLKSQQVAEEVLYRTTKLREVEGCRNIYIKKNRNEEERKRHSELVEQARALNDERSEEEKNAFFWRVMGDQVRKWYMRRRDGEEGREEATGGGD